MSLVVISTIVAACAAAGTLVVGYLQYRLGRRQGRIEEELITLQKRSIELDLEERQRMQLEAGMVRLSVYTMSNRGRGRKLVIENQGPSAAGMLKVSLLTGPTAQLQAGFMLGQQDGNPLPAESTRSVQINTSKDTPDELSLLLNWVDGRGANQEKWTVSVRGNFEPSVERLEAA